MELEPHRAFLAWGDAGRLGCIVGDLEMLASGGFDGDIAGGIGSLKIVGHREAGGELIAGCGEDGHVRREHHRTTHNTAGLAGAYAISRHSDGHDVEFSGEVVGHVIGDFATIRPRLDKSAPEDDGWFLAALERIEMLLQSVLVTTERLAFHEQGELGKDEVEELL